jgi:hypothetical protein
MGCLFCDFLNDLYARGACSDDCDAFAADIEILGAGTRVVLCALVLGEPGELGIMLTMQ